MFNKSAKTWRNIITSAPGLQQIFSLKPIPHPKVWVGRKAPAIPGYPGRISLTPIKAISTSEAKDLPADDEHYSIKPATANPLLGKYEDGFWEGFMFDEFIRLQKYWMGIIRVRSHDASCMNMFLTQPPTTCAEVLVNDFFNWWGRKERAEEKTTLTVRNVAGVRYGDLVRAAESDRPSWSVDWAMMVGFDGEVYCFTAGGYTKIAEVMEDLQKSS